MTSEIALQSTEDDARAAERARPRTERAKSTRNKPSPSAPLRRPSEFVSAMTRRTTARRRSAPKAASRVEHTAPFALQKVRRVGLAPGLLHRVDLAADARPRVVGVAREDDRGRGRRRVRAAGLPANGLSYVARRSRERASPRPPPRHDARPGACAYRFTAGYAPRGTPSSAWYDSASFRARGAHFHGNRGRGHPGRSPHGDGRVRRRVQGRLRAGAGRPRVARRARAVGRAAGVDRPRRHGQRAADLGRRDLRRAPRRPQGGPAHRGAGAHREPAVRLRHPVRRLGDADDPARRGAHRARRRDGEHEPGPARHPRRARRACGSARASSRTRSWSRSSTRTAGCTWRRPRTSSRSSTASAARTWTRTRCARRRRRRPPSAAGVFKDEIVPVDVPQGRKTVRVDADDHPRPETTLEGLAALKPAFGKDGFVTAGNASGIVDGAAALVIAGRDEAQRRGLKPHGQHRLLGRGRRAAGDHGHRPRAGIAQGAGSGRPLARGHGPRRGQRGVRGAVPRGREGAGARPRADERERRRHRARPSRSARPARGCCSPSPTSCGGARAGTASPPPASAAARASR